MPEKSDFKQLLDLIEKRDEASVSFIKQILLMASGLLGVLVSLHKTPSPSANGRIAFALSLLSLILGILCLSVALFYQAHVGAAKVRLWGQELLSRSRDENYQKKEVFLENPPKVFWYAEVAGYISLACSLVCLAVYGYLIA